MKKINLFIHKSLNSLLDLANSKNPSCNDKSILLLTEDLFLKADNEKLNILQSKFKEVVRIQDFLTLPFNKNTVLKIVCIGFSDVAIYTRLYEKVNYNYVSNFMSIEFYEVNNASN